MVAPQLQSCPYFIGGEWREMTGLETAPVYNPSRGEVIAEVPLGGAEIVHEAVEAAAAAFPDWRDTPPIERARLFSVTASSSKRTSIASASSSRASTARRSRKRAAAPTAESRTSNTLAASPRYSWATRSKTSRAGSIARPSTNR